MTGKFFPDEPQPVALSPSITFPGRSDWPDLARRTRQALNCCVRGLDMLSSSTEDEFILIAENLENFSIRAREISASAEGIALNVEDIVTLIQFHDITRQRFEKSSMSCRTMTENLAFADNGRCGNNIQKGTTPSASAEDLARFCLSEARAIADAKGEFVSAVATVVQKLEAIAGSVGKKTGNRLAAEIKTAAQGICIHKFAGVVADEVLSSLNEILEDIRQFVPSEAWGHITAGAGSARQADNDAARLQKGIFSKTEDRLGDNVELF